MKLGEGRRFCRLRSDVFLLTPTLSSEEEREFSVFCVLTRFIATPGVSPAQPA